MQYGKASADELPKASVQKTARLFALSIIAFWQEHFNKRRSSAVRAIFTPVSPALKIALETQITGLITRKKSFIPISVLTATTPCKAKIRT
ncbi:hypothetical protein AGMMS49975_08280 [Clostridia bacterium]|nr:hypothetical protein AGMMS49975_08280 [Clostridia bacterium]